MKNSEKLTVAQVFYKKVNKVKDKLNAAYPGMKWYILYHIDDYYSGIRSESLPFLVIICCPDSCYCTFDIFDSNLERNMDEIILKKYKKLTNSINNPVKAVEKFVYAFNIMAVRTNNICSQLNNFIPIK